MVLARGHRYFVWLIAAVIALASGLAGYDAAAQGRNAALRTAISDLILDGKFAEAEPRAKSWLALAEQAGSENAEVADALEALVKIFAGLKRIDDAEAAWRRCVELRVKLVGSNHALVSHTLDIMAGIYLDYGRKNEAQALWREGLKAFRKSPPVAAVERIPNPPDVSHRKVPELIARGKPGDAEAALRQRGDQAALAVFLLDRDRTEEAATIHRRLLEAAPTAERAVSTSILYRQRNLFNLEQEFLRKAVSLQERAVGPQHPELLATFSALAESHERQKDLAGSYAALQRASSIARNNRIRLPFTTPAVAANQLRRHHLAYLRVAARLAREQPSQSMRIARETFEAGQLATETVLNAAMSQMGLRLSPQGSPLRALIGRRHDLEGEWQKLDRQLIGATTTHTPQSQRDALRAQIAALEGTLATIDAQLQSGFPQYFELALPSPLTVPDAQKLLNDTEAIVQFAFAEDEAFVWAISKSGAKFVPIQMAPAAVGREVDALRCGLDAELWHRDADARRCFELVKVKPARDASNEIRWDTLPFETRRAHALYRALLGGVEDVTRGKHLLIVTPGPLAQLPFHVLSTSAEARTIGSSSWLVERHALTVLPAASSLKALRTIARPSAASRPMIGFGNPLLEGPDGRYSELVRLSRERQHCTGIAHQPSGRRVLTRGATPIAVRGNLADAVQLRKQSPLPETADELCAVAKDLMADQDEIHLGARATEGAVKSLSSSGRLARYRTVHFATHGALPGELGGTDQPGLVLTPPRVATSEDDGFLSANEIAELKLDADWVILSACNTAAGNTSKADALSGLGRAFIYAGARSLLVSHWAVDSEATVRLISAAVGAVSRSKEVGRGEGLRRAMLSLMRDANAPRHAHPAYWAPFILVGEGAARY